MGGRNRKKKKLAQSSRARVEETHRDTGRYDSRTGVHRVPDEALVTTALRHLRDVLILPPRDTPAPYQLTPLLPAAEAAATIVSPRPDPLTSATAAAPTPAAPKAPAYPPLLPILPLRLWY